MRILGYANQLKCIWLKGFSNAEFDEDLGENCDYEALFGTAGLQQPT